MSITVQPTLTITIDEQIYQVSETSPEVQQMVQYLDTWRQEEADEASALLKTRAALRDIQNMLLAQIQKDNSVTETIEVDSVETTDIVETIEAEVIAEA